MSVDISHGTDPGMTSQLIAEAELAELTESRPTPPRASTVERQSRRTRSGQHLAEAPRRRPSSRSSGSSPSGRSGSPTTSCPSPGTVVRPALARDHRQLTAGPADHAASSSATHDEARPDRLRARHRDRHRARHRGRPVARHAARHRLADRRPADHAVDRLVPAGDRCSSASHETAILFVVVLGAAPSIAAGVISGIDEVPPPLLRAGKMIGATRHQPLPLHRASSRDAGLPGGPQAGLGVLLAEPAGR